MTEQTRLPRGYRQDRELAIICVLWGVLVCFRLDELIGAVGLRQYYLFGSWLIAFILLTSIFVFDALWHEKPLGAIVLPIFIVFGSMVVAGIVVFGIVYFLGVILAAKVPSGFMVVGLIISLLIWLVDRQRSQDLHPSLVKWWVVGLTVFTAVFILGTGFRSGGKLASSEWFENHQYYLIAYFGDLGDSDTVIFYECNAWALACDEIHRFRTRDYNDTDINLTFLPEQHQLLILVGTELYRHTPAS